MDNRTVTLNSMEVRYARFIGLTRDETAKASGLQQAHGFVGNEATSLAIHVLGAAGEMAFCKWYGIYYEATVGTFKAPDIGADLQIKTRSRPKYELFVRENGVDSHIFVLVYGSIPTFKIIGWVKGHEAKRPEWLHPYGGREAAYFVPHNHLHSPRALGDILQGIVPPYKKCDIFSSEEVL